MPAECPAPDSCNISEAKGSLNVLLYFQLISIFMQNINLKKNFEKIKTIVR